MGHDVEKKLEACTYKEIIKFTGMQRRCSLGGHLCESPNMNLAFLIWGFCFPFAHLAQRQP